MNDWSAVPWNLVMPLIIIQVLLMVVALIDLVRIHETKGPKWLWAILIVVVSILGPIAYFIIGRKQQ
ncbi:negative regulatory protein YxlE [Paenibacillus montaniterrae]|uniref:Negative regulatory protein YxlE n=1 Tax=Paenibacillus montaniterrae TaxID=429341 RepID=A0A919YR09_9BACL|nr:PLD nuclease N-terminal domain-containing protein [Paenibacillus montaniterrae]GIP18493.1 negative regulatory protein YxlE [Paenibacillus montaniterrae]